MDKLRRPFSLISIVVLNKIKIKHTNFPLEWDFSYLLCHLNNFSPGYQEPSEQRIGEIASSCNITKGLRYQYHVFLILNQRSSYFQNFVYFIYLSMQQCAVHFSYFGLKGYKTHYYHQHQGIQPENILIKS